MWFKTCLVGQQVQYSTFLKKKQKTEFAYVDIQEGSLFMCDVCLISVHN